MSIVVVLRIMTKILTFILVLMSFMSCQKNRQNVESIETKKIDGVKYELDKKVQNPTQTEILEFYKKLPTLVNSRQVDVLYRYFSSDFKKSGGKDFLKVLKTNYNRLKKINYQVTEVRISKASARQIISKNTYTVTIEAEESARNYSGTETIVWVRENNHWKIVFWD